MSAKNKLKIAIELLKQFVEIPDISSIQLKNKFEEDIVNLTKFIQQVPMIDDNDYQTERMSLSILNESIQTVIDKMNQFYGFEKTSKQYYKSINIQNIKNSCYQKKQLIQKMTTLLFDDVNKDILRQKNINEFFQQMQIKIKEDNE